MEEREVTLLCAQGPKFGGKRYYHYIELDMDNWERKALEEAIKYIKEEVPKFEKVYAIPFITKREKSNEVVVTRYESKKPKIEIDINEDIQTLGETIINFFFEGKQ